MLHYVKIQLPGQTVHMLAAFCNISQPKKHKADSISLLDMKKKTKQ